MNELAQGDYVLVTEPDTKRTYKGRVRDVLDDGSLYIEGPALPNDSRHLTWTVSAEVARTAVRHDPDFDFYRVSR